jgi:MYXO-CTERM domain-containing protein
MMTVITATLLTIATVSPAASAATEAAEPRNGAAEAMKAPSTLAAAFPPPGAWALMGMGGLALIRARRLKR